MIADVRGYTSFTQERGDVAGARLARKFAEAVRQGLASAGGQLTELRGDEALCVFSSPRLALRAAIALQEQFAAETESEPGIPLQVGIGLDVGEAVSVEGGYRGGALNLAARLCALAGPGEVFASQAVVHLARKVEGLRYVERRARLKGLSEPVRFVSVMPEGVATEGVARRIRARSQRFRFRKRALPRRRWLALMVVALLALLAALVAILAGGGNGLGSIASDSVGTIDARSGRFVASTQLNGKPAGLAYGDGALWTVNATAAAVSQIDPTTRAVEDTVGVGSSPSDVAAGDGAIWVTNSESSTVSEINPDANRIVQTTPVGTGPRGIAVSRAGVFVANSLDGTISRIDPRSGKVSRKYPVGGTPTALALGAGAIWVVSEASGTVSRIAPASGSVLAAINVGNGPTDIAFGGGAAWVANSVDGTVSKIDAATNRVSFTVPVGGDPEAIAVGSSGVWVANANATVAQLDLHSGAIRRRLHIGSIPQSIVVKGRNVWVATGAAPGSHRGGTLRVVISNDNGTLDPAAAFADDAWRLLVNVYDGLVAFRRVGGAAGGTIVADLATTVPSPSGGGKTYTFQLRKGIHYSDGETLRASDFRHALQRTLTLGAGATIYSGIVGAAQCHQEPKRCDLSKGIQSDDKQGIVTFHLAAPDPDFLYKLALPFASAVARSTPDRVGRNVVPAGTGPYRVARYRPGQSALLVRNKFFHTWAANAQPDGYPDNITATDIGDSTRQISALLRGRADVALPSPFAKPPRQLHALTTRYAAQLHLDPLGAVFYLFLNTQRPPFNDINARRAVAYAIDRGTLAGLAGGTSLAEPTCQILPPQFPGYRPYCPFTLRSSALGLWTAPDSTVAQKLIARTRARGLRITVGATPDLVYLVRPLIAALAHLGYKPVLRRVSPSGQVPPATNADLNAWFKDYTAPSDFIDSLFTCRAGFNIAHFCDPTIDALVRRAEASQALNSAAVNNLWARIDRTLTDQAPAVPLYAPRSIALLSKRAGNYAFNPQWGPLLDQLWVR